MFNERKYGESGMSCKNDKSDGIGKGGEVGKGGEIGKGGGIGKGGDGGKSGEISECEICRCGKGGNDSKLSEYLDIQA